MGSVGLGPFALAALFLSRTVGSDIEPSYQTFAEERDAVLACAATLAAILSLWTLFVSAWRPPTSASPPVVSGTVAHVARWSALAVVLVATSGIVLAARRALVGYEDDPSWLGAIACVLGALALVPYALAWRAMLRWGATPAAYVVSRLRRSLAGAFFLLAGACAGLFASTLDGDGLLWAAAVAIGLSSGGLRLVVAATRT